MCQVLVVFFVCVKKLKVVKCKIITGKEFCIMRRFIAVLAGLLTLPAFAEDVLHYNEDGSRSMGALRSDDAVVADGRSGRSVGRDNSSVRSTISRVVPTATSDTGAKNRNVAGARVVASARSGAVSAVADKKTVARPAGVLTRAAMVSRERSGVLRSGAETATVSRAAAPATSRVSSRAATVSASVSTSDGGVSVGNASNVTARKADAASVTAAMEDVASLTAFCKAQYTECMDNFCNVLDDNQGRCSCSKNVKNYEKTEKALKAATESLQDVAQQIQYIGLSKDEIETLFSQTEAEIQMQATTDNSQIKNDLDKIKGLIVQVKSGTASSSDLSGGLSMDLSGLMSFDISSAGFDLSSMFGNQTANTGSISNQRGEQLYKTAAARCRAAVLNECREQGVDIAVVSNSYDLEIDKQCVAYERALTDANDEMAQTVRNAKSVLQRARLMVAQQKNSYDLRGCINALDSCMQDDYVCGNDYENCLDPSGKYVVDGAIVVGSMPGQAVPETLAEMDPSIYSVDGLYATWNYKEGTSTYNVWGKDGTVKDGGLANYVTATMQVLPTGVGATVSEYLQYKIGYIDGDKVHGMCSSVLKKCQDYTYSNGRYNHKNRVIEEYLTRTLVKIKTGQDKILSDYAASCISDVVSCLGENNYDGASSSTQSKIAINACRSRIITCMSVNGNAQANPTPAGMAEWVGAVMNTNSSGSSSGGTSSGTNGGTTSTTKQKNCGATAGTWSGSSCVCPTGHIVNSAGYCYVSGISSGTACTIAGGTWLTGISPELCFCSGGKSYSGNSCV